MKGRGLAARLSRKAAGFAWTAAWGRFCLLPAHGIGPYLIKSLGSLGGDYSVGNAISPNGLVTGASSLPGESTYRAFLYDGAMQDLGLLGGESSFGFDVNASGQVVGVSSLPGEQSQIRGGFLYDSSIQDMRALGPFRSPFSAESINDAGHITGAAPYRDDTGSVHAYFFDGTWHDIGPEDAQQSYGYDINNLGHIVGTYDFEHAFYCLNDGSKTLAFRRIL